MNRPCTQLKPGGLQFHDIDRNYISAGLPPIKPCTITGRPNFFTTRHMLLGMSFTETLQYDEAIRAFEMAIRLGERAPTGLANLGWAYAKAGRIEEARALLTELRDISKTRYIPPCCLAWIHLGLGEIDLCLDWLHKAAEVHDNILFLMLPIHNSRAEPSDPLRSHPRYHALLRKMNLEA